MSHTPPESLAGWRTASRWASRAAGAVVLASAVLVAVDVIARKVFSHSLGGSDELSGYALAIASSWGCAAVLLSRGNVRIDVLYQHLGARLRAALDIVNLVALGSFVALLLRHGWSVVEASWSMDAVSNTPLQTPLWIPQGLWLAGLAFLGATLLALLVRAVAALLRGDLAEVNRLAGARTAEEEAAEEGHLVLAEQAATKSSHTAAPVAGAAA